MPRVVLEYSPDFLSALIMFCCANMLIIILCKLKKLTLINHLKILHVSFYLTCPWHEGPLEESVNRTQRFVSIFNEVAEEESILDGMKSQLTL
jgi:hypothetical protein